MESEIQGETLPILNRALQIGPVTYTCTVTGDTWKRDGFFVNVSEDLLHTGKSYNDSLAMIPQGYRMADSDIFAYIAQQTSKLKSEGREPREILEDPIFERQIKGGPYRWEHTHMILKPSNRAKNFTKYVETDGQGRKYSRIDKYSGENLVAEGALMPWGDGSNVVEINPALGLPAIVSVGSEQDHVIHSYFNPDLSEVAVGLGGDWRAGERGRCLYFGAFWGPSYALSYDAFRLVQGSLGEIPNVSHEQFVKDRDSYEKGLKKGLKQGRQDGTDEVIQALSTLPVAEVLRMYKKQ